MKQKLSLLALTTFGLCSAVLANPQPLKQEGKQTLFQRVLSTPNCALSDVAGKADGKKIPALPSAFPATSDKAQVGVLSTR